MQFRSGFKTGILFLSFWAACSFCTAQKSLTDTVVPLKEVDVSAARLNEFSVGTKIVRVDSTDIATCKTLSLADMLNTLSLVAVKSYGAGSLATISMRGTGAAHVAVLWNGFSLQSPMNGGTDISLLPVFFADKVTLQYGGAGALFGSGALGGSIHFENKPSFNRGWNISAGGAAGSFDDYSGHFSALFSGKKSVSSTKIFYNTAQNNYPFTNITLSGKPLAKLRHAAIVSTGLLQENYLKIGTNQEINIRIWCQDEQREIPPLMVKPYSNATQDDRFARLSAGWQRTSTKVDLQLRSGLFYDIQHYVNPDINTDALLTSVVSSTDAESSFRPAKGHIINAAMNVTYAQAASDNYSETAIQQTESLFVSWKYVTKNGNLKTAVSLREEAADGNLMNPVPAAGIEWNLFKGFTMYANGSGVYRLPTLNDRYWVPGGNRDLKPEQGWTEELGLRHEIKIKTFSTSYEISAFNSNIHNWIIWLPLDSYWSPRNLLEVWSRGTEAAVNAGFSKKSWLVKVSASINYVKSTNQKSKYENDASVGKQLIYMPQISAFGRLELGWHDLQLIYLHSYTGSRYTTSDNSFFLEPYQTGKVHLSNKFHLSHFTIEIYGNISNIWNTEYQSIAWMPGSGRSFKVGLVLNTYGRFKNSKSK
jgi:iron complex outermembrane receptor protein